MNEKYFLNEDLFYIDKSLYKISGDKNVLVNRKNWYSSLKNYGWEKLKLSWRQILESNFFSVVILRLKLAGSPHLTQIAKTLVTYSAWINNSGIGPKALPK